ncbi:LysE family transporter [Microbacterium sp. EYE_5]|uniref:LysE/ArgO family amino acid transporter n=1 Tax=unclassified Microbacterium TaxID=2609290 RepID=UPI0020050F88|nr:MULTISPECIES: LysE family transporter [unclassified Microbacterium]MCK6081235.1 LysE family transporter [Microbacterium sp. EYE_382]MCK6086505.1 LysE family transporter [Microbacterium sp. EYE_384]MCK6123997.1 LysE family transporter [Microbacterium sp. EYE_80]MCK6126906.1 LysE family transporter [Microbacterium sp. EYE_79]MCK6142190.1 LysE family transporter [Microbacterium sp. EYE_39]
MVQNHSLYCIHLSPYRRRVTPELLALLSGLGLCLGLIVSIGAQNAIVLRQGLRREHVGLVVLVCVVSDAILQTIGVAGIATIVTAHPWLETLARWAGAAFIVGFAFVSARRAWRGGGSLEAAADDADAPAGAPGAVLTKPRTATRTATLLTILAVTWLNPHALVETTVVLGSVAGTHGDARWWFLAGGIAASTLWFVVFGYGARYLAPLLRTERAWRILDGGIAVVMVIIAAGLVLG